MVTIGLFPNTKKTNVHKVLAQVVHYLKDRKVRIMIPEDVAKDLNYSDLGVNRETIKEVISLGISLGGDGTLLNTAREIAPAGIPICGINMGQLGFLTEVELPELHVALDKLICSDYKIEERLMLDGMIIRQEDIIHVGSALNDVVVTKGGFSRMIKLKLFINRELAGKYSADGLIVSTSTGSTGYSLSAGGPIVHPNLNVILLTPICPHTLYARSMIVSEEEEIEIKVQSTHNDIHLTIDGQKVCNLLPGDVVRIERSNFRAKFIKFSGKSYYEVLRNKLQWSDIDEKC